MSLKSSKQIDKNYYELTLGIDGATFKAAVDKVFKRSVKNITVPGFRRGKAPRSIIEKMYGKGVFYEDAINDCLPDVYEAAVKEFGMPVVGRPEFDLGDVDENGATITAKVYTKPEMTLKAYKGLTATRDEHPVTDADIDEEIERVRARNSRMIEVTDRPVADGDTANIDYEGSVDGVPFEGGKDAGHDLAIGSGSFIPGFEEQIIGHAIGDEFDVNVTFPTEYHAAELAGKAAVFKVKVNAIKMNEKPELDDEFAKDVSEFDTLAEYRADIKAKMEEHAKHHADSEVDEQLVSALVENLEGDIPEVMYEAESENIVRDFDMRLRMQGMDLQTYFQYTGMTLDGMREQSRPQAERQVKSRLALETVAKLEGIEATEEEINKEYESLAEAYGMEADKVRETVTAEDLAADIKVRKAVDFIRDNAKIGAAKKTAAKKPAAKKTAAKKEEAPAEEATAEKAPAKKPAAKKTTAKKAEAPAEEAPAAEKAPAKKPAAKKTTAKKAEAPAEDDPAKKPAAKKAPAKKKAEDKE